VDAQGQHGLICKQAPSKMVRHSAINDIIARSLASAGIPTSKEPIALTRLDGKHPDGITLVPWQCGKQITGDVTVVSTLAQSYLCASSHSAGGAAELATSRKEPNTPACPRAFFFSQSPLKLLVQLPLPRLISCAR